VTAALSLVAIRVRGRGAGADGSPCGERTTDGRYFGILGQDGHALLVSAASNQLIRTFKLNGAVRSLAFTSDSSRMFSAGGAF